MAIFEHQKGLCECSLSYFRCGLLVSLFLSDFNLIGTFEIDAPNVETILHY